MDDAELWSEFLEFIERAPAAPHPGVLFEGFREELVSQGLPAELASEGAAHVREMSRDRSDWAAPMFDRIYTSDQAKFSAEPNEFVVRMIADTPAGRALDVAMGQGRNAVHLARHGWDVTGFDVSEVGLAAASRAATAAGTSLTAVRSTSEAFDYGTDAWDLVVVTYALVPVTAPAFVAMIASALRPGGMVVIESFAVDGEQPSRPVDLDPDVLRIAYDSFFTVAFEREVVAADWTLQAVPIVRLAARRPG